MKKTKSKKNTEHKIETKASNEQVAHWNHLYQLFNERPLDDSNLMVSLGLFMRSSALAKILFIHELYEMIKNKPGIIVEFGCFWGQNLVLFENLRAIYEPFNPSRRIVGFDTFSGYEGFSDFDRRNPFVSENTHSTTHGYKEYLESLLKFHEQNNVLKEIKKTELIEGNCIETVPKYFHDNPEAMVALAYFDMALYEPTKAALNAIKPRLMPGSILLMDEFNNRDMPGETVAFREVFSGVKYEIQTSKFIADRSIIVIT
jgi:hypothetical protein